MGLFDVSINNEITSEKSRDEILTSIANNLKEFSKEDFLTQKDEFDLKSFRSSILKYNLNGSIKKSEDGYSLNINGELQQSYVWILIVLIILSILVTYGIGVVFIVAFSFLQKQSTSKSLNALLRNVP